MQHKRLKQIGILVLLVNIAATPLVSQAQSANYMDESGNIYFVERPQDVPLKYRHQVIPPKPTPNLTRKEFERMQADNRRAEKERQMALQRKKQAEVRAEQDRKRKAEKLAK